MAAVFENDEQLKEILKTAIVEVLQERKDLIREIVEEILEDIAFSQAIEEGNGAAKVDPDQIF